MPWRTEPLVYGSDLADRLPEGLSMPRAARVDFLPDDAAAIWLPDVSRPPRPWDPSAGDAGCVPPGAAGRQPPRRAAGHRSASSPGSRPTTSSGGSSTRSSRCSSTTTCGEHPLVATSFDAALRDRVLAALHDAPALAAELAAYPVLTAHGDACPNNLLPGRGDDDVVLIDFQFWNALPVGFDLGQLLVGDVQIGRGRADTLAETEAAIVPAYVEGLRAEGCDLPLAAVRRAHALQLAIFSGISAVPFDLLPRWDDASTPRPCSLSRATAPPSPGSAWTCSTRPASLRSARSRDRGAAGWFRGSSLALLAPQPPQERSLWLALLAPQPPGRSLRCVPCEPRTTGWVR